jgi:hypothetical protein
MKDQQVSNLHQDKTSHRGLPGSSLACPLHWLSFCLRIFVNRLTTCCFSVGTICPRHTSIKLTLHSSLWVICGLKRQRLDKWSFKANRGINSVCIRNIVPYDILSWWPTSLQPDYIQTTLGTMFSKAHVMLWRSKT